MKILIVIVTVTDFRVTEHNCLLVVFSQSTDYQNPSDELKKQSHSWVSAYCTPFQTEQIH